jgi:ethanolamine permease
MPRGIVAAMGVLVVLAVLMLVFTPGAAGSSAIMESGNPPVDALAGAGASEGLTDVVNYAGLFGLVASFFSIIYAYSRQTFALSRAGYLPRALSVTNARKAPVLALLVPGAIGFVLSLLGEGATLLNMAVFGATVSYVLMMVSHIVLRRREPDLPRPYRTPGGTVTTGVALVLAAAAVVATFLVDVTAALWTLAAYVVFLAWFALYSRHHLVASAPEEEFELLADAQDDVR